MPTEGCRNVSKPLDSSLTCMYCAVSCDYVIHMSCKHMHTIYKHVWLHMIDSSYKTKHSYVVLR